ncbi:MAG: adenylate/guanylate cyclase domain-containing protein [Candidatus Bathyarchaeota archaeon]|nr:adenylate/guanylate cyclase domain-containing protein [Candidatus Bathyarchaeota archaeon]
MKSNYAEYDPKRGIERINQISQSSDSNFEKHDEIPARNLLTNTNGFHVKCAVLSAKICQPAELCFNENNPLARQYKAYLSEVTAVMNGNPKCVEITVAGNSVSGIFDAPWQDDINEVFAVAGKISAVVRLINQKFMANPIKIGIGLSYGKALMIKLSQKLNDAGEVIWAGEVLNEALRLASYGNKESADKETMVSEIVYHNLDDENKKLLLFNSARDCYHGSIVNSHLTKWYKQNCP